MLARRARTSKSWDHVFNFRTCDVALSSLITFNRPDASTCATRRRAFGATGPSRTNYKTWSEKLDEAGGWAGNAAAAAAAESYKGSAFWTLTKTTSSGSENKSSAVPQATAAGEYWSVELTLLATATSSSASVGLFHDFDAWGLFPDSAAVVVEGPGSLTQQFGALWGISGLSETAPTTIKITRRVASNDGVYVYVYPGNSSSTTIGHATKVTRVHLGKGVELGPYIPTTSAPVTTTDWPRTNYIAKSNKFSSAVWPRWLAGTGVVPSIVSEAVPSPTGSLDATRITFDQGAGNTLGDISAVYYDQAASLSSGAPYCAGIWARIPLGVTISVRSVAANGYMAMVGTGQWKRYSRPETAASAFSSLVIGLRGGLGIGQSTGRVTVDLWHCTLEPGSELTATIPNDTTAPLTVNTPPFGQLTTVAANVPQLEYDKDGIGRGLRVDGAATQLLSTTKGFKANWANNGPMTGWQDNYGVAPDGTVTTTFAVDNGTAYKSVSATIGVPLKFSVFVRAGTANIYMLYADGAGLVHGSAWIERFFGTHAVNSFTAPVTGYGVDGDAVDGMQRVWFEVTPTATGSIAFHIYPINGTTEFWGANVTTGNLTSYIEGPHTRAAASVVINDLAKVALDGDEWTVLVEMDEPALDPTPGYPMLFRVDGGAGVVNITKQPSGNVNFQVYDGTTSVEFGLAGVAAGTRRRYMIGVSRTQGLMRYAATGAGPATVSNAAITTLPPLTVARIGSANGYWFVNSTVAEVRTARRLMTLEEFAAGVAL